MAISEGILYIRHTQVPPELVHRIHAGIDGTRPVSCCPTGVRLKGVMKGSDGQSLALCCSCRVQCQMLD